VAQAEALRRQRELSVEGPEIAPAAGVAGQEAAPGARGEAAAARNVYDRTELAGAFGDLGTLVPFVAGYVAVTGLDPAGILVPMGLGLVAVGLVYRTPIPVQPMKAIGGAAIASGGGVTAAMVCGAGLFTGAFWLLAGATGLLDRVGRLAAKPVVRGIVLGLGLVFVRQGIELVRTAPWLGAGGLLLTLALLARPRVPAMFALLVLGAIAGCALDPEGARALLAIRPGFRLPSPGLRGLTWADLAAGTAVLAVPQLPLTYGNAIVAMRAENNALFPERPVADRTLAISHGLLNLLSAPLGGIPLCHGAGGMAGHVRFGARTGGSTVMLGGILLIVALFLGDSVVLLFRVFPHAILGVILFFAGMELALGAAVRLESRADAWIALAVAGFAMWNIGVAFLVGVALHQASRRGWLPLG
jgi:predicted benzoate:H+ symporter BenE